MRSICRDRSSMRARPGRERHAAAFAVSSSVDPVNDYGPPLSFQQSTFFGRCRVRSASGAGGIFCHALEVLEQPGRLHPPVFFANEANRLPQNFACVTGAVVNFTDRLLEPARIRATGARQRPARARRRPRRRSDGRLRVSAGSPQVAQSASPAARIHAGRLATGIDPGHLRGGAVKGDFSRVRFGPSTTSTASCRSRARCCSTATGSPRR